MRRDLGDFQTPPPLVAEVLRTLDVLGITYSRVLEPTCGEGRFLAALLARAEPPGEVWGIETQAEHLTLAESSMASLANGKTTIHLRQADFFASSLRNDLPWSADGPLLVLGNPPWITSAELGKIGGDNGPVRFNVKGLKGLEARTGSANFDLSEAVWIKLVRELAHESPTIALLCKASVARNVLAFAGRDAWPVVSASFHRIDSRKWFGASVDAGLFRVTLGNAPPRYEVDVYPSLGASEVETRLGLVDGVVVADLDRFEGVSALFRRSKLGRQWRQGIKHDAATVLELIDDGHAWRNSLGERVEVEPDRIYPLVKAADLARADGDAPRRGLIVPQVRLSEDLAGRKDRSPKLMAYLEKHADRFAKRKSSIYRGRPPFSIFGVGPYSFEPEKVAVSGMRLPPRFRAVEPVDGRPVVFDDTTYFLPCETSEDAAKLAESLNGPGAQDLIRALSFPGSKRPITKALLQRINLDGL